MKVAGGTRIKPLYFIAFTFLLIATIVYSEALRKRFLVEELQFIPSEVSILLALGEIETLWTAMDRHFGRVIREENGDSFLRSQVRSIQGILEKRKLKIKGVESFTEYGLDIRRGALFGVDKEQGLVVVVHIGDVQRFENALAQLAEVTSAPTPKELMGKGDERFSVRSFDRKLYVAYPKPELAVVTTSQALMHRSLVNRIGNLHHHRQSDGLYKVVTRLVNRPLLSGPVVFFSAHPEEPFLERIAGSFRFEKELVRVEIDAKVATGVLRVLDQVFVKPPLSSNWQEYLAADTPAVMVVHDEGLTDYLRFMSSIEDLGKVMQEDFGGILDELSRVHVLRRLVLAITEYRSGLPEFMLGIWGDPSELRRLVEDMQIKLLKKHQQKVSRQMTKLGLRPTAVDSPPGMFQRLYKQWPIEYLFPPITETDLKYLPEFEGIDSQFLLNDRYRLATVIVDGVLWVTTDIRDLEALLDRKLTHDPDLSRHAIYQWGKNEWRNVDKVQAIFDVERLTTLGLLSSDSKIEPFTKKFLLDLRYHSATSFTVAPNGVGDELIFSMLLKRTGA